MGWGCLRILRGIEQFSVVTERGSEYNIVEWENYRKLTAIEGGGGDCNITEPLRGSGEENQANFIGHNQNHPIPLP